MNESNTRRLRLIYSQMFPRNHSYIGDILEGIYRGHYITNPNNALWEQKCCNVTIHWSIVCIVWTLPNGIWVIQWPLIYKMTTLQGTNISPLKGTFEADFPFLQVGHVSSPEGTVDQSHVIPRMIVLNHRYAAPSLRSNEPLIHSQRIHGTAILTPSDWCLDNLLIRYIYLIRLTCI